MRLKTNKTGTTSSLWTLASNWGGTAPLASDNIIIPTGTPNQPTLDANRSYVIVTINGGTLTLSGFVLTATTSMSITGGTISGSGTFSTATFSQLTGATFTGLGTFPPGGAPYSGTAANAVAIDKHAVNGVYHIIDRVLLPQ